MDTTPDGQAVADIMVKDVISVSPDTSLLEAANTLIEHNFTGLPVVRDNNELAGLLTEYDLIEKGTAVHLPTLAALLGSVHFNKGDADMGLPELSKIKKLKVRDVMNDDPLTLPPTATVTDAVEVFAHHHAINPVPIVDDAGILQGILARFDIVRLFHADTDGRGVSQFTAEHQKLSDRPQVGTVLQRLDDDFVVVSKARARWWIVGSILFGAVGFIIAFAIIIRLT